MQRNTKQLNERMGDSLYVLVWKELQDIGHRQKKLENNGVHTLLPFGGEAGTSVFAHMCVRVSGRTYKKLITMVTYFGVARRT